MIRFVIIFTEETLDRQLTQSEEKLHPSNVYSSMSQHRKNKVQYKK